ncbi:hypothetical protein [Sporosarcina sp. FSL W7-1283]|uniref:hypothetical protein n=1 Tax=Sporosarcina sp. FSL W7-1283 TaxID=2921560 RepID=UPI0030F81329
MNGNQQRKALDYAIAFLTVEIAELEETIKESENLLLKRHLEQRLKDLKVDYDMFLDIAEEY